MSGYRDEDGTKPKLLEIAAAKTLLAVGFGLIILLAWAVGLINF